MFDILLFCIYSNNFHIPPIMFACQWSHYFHFKSIALNKAYLQKVSRYVFIDWLKQN